MRTKPKENALPENPFESPGSSATPSHATPHPIDQVGFYLSIAGFTGVSLVGPFGQIVGYLGMTLSILSIPGLVISLHALVRRRSRLAIWGAGIGLFAASFLPTFYLSVRSLLK